MIGEVIGKVSGEVSGRVRGEVVSKVVSEVIGEVVGEVIGELGDGWSGDNLMTRQRKTGVVPIDIRRGIGLPMPWVSRYLGWVYHPGDG